MHGARCAVEPASGMPHLRACRLLRGLEARARAPALQCDRPSDDRVAGTRRGLGLVLRRPSLFRSDARAFAEEGDRPPSDLEAVASPLTRRRERPPASRSVGRRPRERNLIFLGIPPMIIVHHLNNSRSQRVLWLLEELGLDYEIRRYERDSETMLAPASLRAVHPLGKSTVITDG